MMNCEGLGRKRLGFWLILKYYYSRGFEENHSNINQYSQLPDLYLNPQPP
jgi:hypothetical protein